MPFYWLADTGRLDLGGAIGTGLLYVLFLGFWPWWGRRVHRLKRPWQALGLRYPASFLRDHLRGSTLGIASVGVLMLIQVAAGWAVFQSPVAPLPLVLEAVLVGTLVGLAEELLFRGWLLFELEQGYSAAIALWINSLLFAAVHFIKPLPAILATLPQFFGLLLLGVLLVCARRLPVSPQRMSQNHVGQNLTPNQSVSTATTLGWPMGLHGGLVGGYYLVSVGNLVTVTNRIPAWVTGLQQNPLAGLLGLLLLGGLVFIFHKAVKQPGKLL